MDAQSVKTVEESGRIRGYDAHKCVKGRKRHLLVVHPVEGFHSGQNQVINKMGAQTLR